MIVLAVFYALTTILAFFGNLFVLLVVTMNRSVHKMRYFLLASLALSDFLFATLITSNRTVATALEEWIFGTTWCHGAAFLIRSLHISTVLHLCAVSYERYNAIVKKPLTYNGRITKKKAFLNIMLLWILPAVISLGPLIGWGDYVYNPDIFACEQKWDRQTTFPFLIASFLAPLGVIFILNYKVLKVVRRLQNSVEIINVQPDAENKMHDCQNEQRCYREDQDTDHIPRHQKQQREQGGTENGEQETSSQIVNVIVHCNPLSHSANAQGETNAAYQEEPNDIAETIRQEEAACQMRRNGNSARYRPRSLENGHNDRSSVKTREDGPTKVNKKTVESGCSKAKKSLDQREKRHTQPQVEERYQEDILAKMELQIHVIEDHQSSHESQNGALEDGNGSKEKRACEAQPRNDILDRKVVSSDNLLTKSAWKMLMVPKATETLQWKIRSDIQEVLK
ncbi:Alpha-1A adrenergic receptor [Desmophyllum pertusum]|uniref:Alpha-1A adrenergic receptor n=1 Tax=Desmophyllum pertusum TaxID=174260 RepID=A0A9W9Y8Q3_9CNID|nr:Alpha-1A adrenergic receptor [Desmophyllum pertusum]